MAFKDRYPAEIEFEIDRHRLLRYWRIQAVIGCCAGTLPLAIMVGAAFFRIHLESQPNLAVASRFAWFILYAAAGAFAGLFVAGVIYLLMYHVQAKLASQNLRLIVEGPYLRVASGGYFVTDRRIHFRAISDYSTHEGPLLRKLQMKSLSFRVGSSGQIPSSQHVVGLICPDDVRDQLCEVDAAREKGEN